MALASTAPAVPRRNHCQLRRVSVQLRSCMRVSACPCAKPQLRSGRVAVPVCAPQPDVDEEEGSPIDFPEEYVPPQPSRRPDIFPEFEPLETPTPTRPPGDPELPDEFEWEEDDEDTKRRKRVDPDHPDPDFPEEEEEKKKEEEEEGGEEEGLPAPKPSEE